MRNRGNGIVYPAVANLCLKEWVFEKIKKGLATLYFQSIFNWESLLSSGVKFKTGQSREREYDEFFWKIGR